MGAESSQGAAKVGVKTCLLELNPSKRFHIEIQGTCWRSDGDDDDGEEYGPQQAPAAIHGV